MHRRQFLTATASTAALLHVTPVRAGKAPQKYRTALIGSGWWGMNILREAAASGRSKIVALCDVDPKPLTVSADEVNDLTGDTPKKYPDYRDMLDKEKPEIVIIATPDHWHALTTIAALKAGAHVFVEKPTGHTINESKAMLKAARAAGKVVEVGLHRRIGPHNVSGMKFLRDGGAGKIGMVRLFVHQGGGAEAPTANTDPPKGMNWDMWCGPAPMRPFNSKLHPGGWRQFLDFGNGNHADWGVHWIDQVLWWSEEKAPRRVFSAGGRPIRGRPVATEREMTTDAPDSQVATFEFESFTAVWEHRQFAENRAEKHSIGAYFYGSKGTFHMGWRDGWTFYPADEKAKILHEKSDLQEPDGHNIKLLWADFLKAIDDGGKPVADIEQAHRSTTAVLLAMLSLKLGRSVAWDAAKEQIIGDAEANKLLARKYREPWKYPE